jgi:hypothetical protein
MLINEVTGKHEYIETQVFTEYQYQNISKKFSLLEQQKRQ